MKNCVFRPRTGLLGILLTTIPFLQAVNWPPSGNVTDANIVLTGNVTLGLGSTTIHAQAANVDITMTASSIISGSNLGASQLYLVADAGRTITFHVTQDLTFVGSSSIGLEDLVIVQSGPGTVNWIIDGGINLSFTGALGTGSTQYWLLMDAVAPTANFSRNTGVLPGSNIFVNVGPNSIISYLSQDSSLTAGDSALINFNSANTGLGNMALNIVNTGGVVVAGHFTSAANGTSVNLGNIDRSLAAGTNAQFSVSNTLAVANGGFWVLNRNATYSSDVNGEQGNWLFDPFFVLCARQDVVNYKGTFSGVRYGWTLGANGTVLINNNAFMNYVGLNIDVTPNVFTNGCIDFDGPADHKIKKRNPSAFIVDGNNNPAATPANITFGTNSALFFRSGVDADNVVENDLASANPFVIDPTLRSPDSGNVVFAVEGELNVVGNSDLTSKIELLSWQVDYGTGALFVGGGQTIFPKRTFAQDVNDVYLQYNAGKFLINNHLNLTQTSLSHTDENHIVIKKNSCLSEPAYVGGETFTLLPLTSLPQPVTPLDIILARPKIEFINSRLLVNTDIAFTGVDLLVPNICDDNISTFVFYYNGYAVDNGTGRNMIMGTKIGSYVAACLHSVSTSAHIDIIQTQDCPLPTDLQELDLTVAANNNTINPDIVGVITGQVSTNSIYLSANSNISIGTDADSTGFDNDTFPWLRIAGNSFSFDTGSPAPQDVGIVGLGGIFVDLNGQFTINPQLSATINTMVTRSRNAYVNLPTNEVFFGPGVGITAWQPDMSEGPPSNPDSGVVLVSAAEHIADFSINWALQVIKDYSVYTPFPIVNDLDCLPTPVVTTANVTAIPEILGTVDQLQIQGSRFSDPATIKINGGHVGEVVFQQGCEPGEFNGAIIVLENGGTVGLGSARRNVPSVQAATVLGRNGVTIIVNGGGGKVVLNDNMLVQGVCAFLLGPTFDPATDVFEIEAPMPAEIRVKNGSILDLRSFGTTPPGPAILKLNGYTQIAMEPNTIMLFENFGTLQFNDNTQLNFNPSLSTDIVNFFNAIPLGAINNLLPVTSVAASLPHNQYSFLTGYGAGLGNTDTFRVRIVGEGALEFNDDAIVNLPANAFVGIESLDITDPSCGLVTALTTNMIISLTDNATFYMGRASAHERGGVLQVGNTTNIDGSVSLIFELNGEAAKFLQGPGSFLGLGVGVVRAGVTTMNELLVDTLFNVRSIEFDFFNGEWQHNRIFDGDTDQASLVAIAEGISYTSTFGSEIGANFNITNNDMNIAGGGNMVYILPEFSVATTGALYPIVRTQDNLVTINPVTGETHSRMRVSIMSSLLLRQHQVNLIGTTGLSLFNDWKTNDATANVVLVNGIPTRNGSVRANAGPQGEGFRSTFGQIRLGAVVIPDGGGVAHGGTPMIVREEISNNLIKNIRGGGGSSGSNGQEAVEIGAVAAKFNPTTGAFITPVTNLY